MKLNKSFQKNKKSIKSKRGVSSIEFVIGALISIVIFAAFLDFLVISNRMQAMATTMTYLTRTISNQGCLANNPEATCLLRGVTAGYSTDYIKNKKFITSSEIFTQVDEIMRAENIPRTDWTVRINGTTLTSSTTTRLFDFREEIDINITVKARWTNVSNFLLINLPDIEFNSNQTTLSLYKFRIQGSESGFDYGN